MGCSGSPKNYLNSNLFNKDIYLLQEMLKHWETNKMFLINFEDKLHNNFSFKGSFRFNQYTAGLFWSPKFI